MTLTAQQVSATVRARLCNLDPPSRPATCTSLHRACFDEEQIVLHGPNAMADAAAATVVLARSPNLYDVKKPGHFTGVHRMLQLAAPGRPYTYVPLAVSASRALRSLQPSTNRSVFEVDAVQPEAPASFSDATALAFVTTWANAWQETFHRAVIQVFEEWCRVGGEHGAEEHNVAGRRDMVVVPTAYAPCGRPPCAGDDSRLWLRPFSEVPVWPMSLTPQPEPLQQAVFGNRPCNDTCFGNYRALSAAYFAARPRQCFERVRLCDFSRTRPARPWATVQAVLARHTLRPPDPLRLARAMLGHGSVTLQVTIVLRARRRRLSNLDDLLAACARWGGQGGLGRDRVRVSCVAESFAPGLVAMAPAIRRTDVLVGPHGADLVNGLGLHAGASVVEVLPVHKGGCPCGVFQGLFAMERRVFHYTASSSNASYATSRARGLAGTFHSDLVLPPAVLEAALSHVLDVGGALSAYKFRNFAY